MNANQQEILVTAKIRKRYEKKKLLITANNMEKKTEENILFPRKKEMKNNNPKMIHLNIDKVLGQKKKREHED